MHHLYALLTTATASTTDLTTGPPPLPLPLPSQSLMCTPRSHPTLTLTCTPCKVPGRKSAADISWRSNSPCALTGCAPAAVPLPLPLPLPQSAELALA